MTIVRVDIDEANALERALEALRTDGVLLVRDLLDKDFLRQLEQRMNQDTLRLLDYCERIGGNPRARGQLQQGAPPYPPYLVSDLLAHPFIWAIIGRTLGPGAGLMFYNGNTNCPGSAPQQVHLDQDHKSGAPAPIRCLVVGIPPQPTSASNGALEVWPGTHDVVAPRLVGAEQLEQRRRQRPPLQVETQLGEVIVRDARLWHRAVTNPSTTFRHMLGAVYHATPKAPITFDHQARPVIEGLNLNPKVVYADLSKDYLIGPTRWLKAVQDQDQAEPSSDASDTVARPMTEL